jgi:hypothetical protein
LHAPSASKSTTAKTATWTATLAGNITALVAAPKKAGLIVRRPATAFTIWILTINAVPGSFGVRQGATTITRIIIPRIAFLSKADGQASHYQHVHTHNLNLGTNLRNFRFSQAMPKEQVFHNMPYLN